jgi:hypothetical protein
MPKPRRVSNCPRAEHPGHLSNNNRKLQPRPLLLEPVMMVGRGAVQNSLQQVRSKDSNEREEARERAQRLWWAAAPALWMNGVLAGDCGRRSGSMG